MTLRQLILLRRFSTSRTLARPALSAEYKSIDSWDARFNCPMLNDVPTIRSINSKILNNSELDNVEVDIFINIAAPKIEDIAHLQETVKILKNFRRSLRAHTMLPSSHHAACRLFIDSKRLPSLITMLENRVDFGIFPDAFALNLIFDEALEQGKLSLASRAAALIMLQEEFGINKISDRFALYSTAKYIESKTDFDDWSASNLENDPIFNASLQPGVVQDNLEEQEKSAKQEEEGEEDEEEEDAEYRRIPFLRNPYFDNHFDLTNPRAICGKTLSMIGIQLTYEKADELANKCLLLGSILQGRWLEAKNVIEKSVQTSLAIDASTKELSQHYITKLHDVEVPDEVMRSSLLSGLEKLSHNSKYTISEQVKSEFTDMKDLEQQDISWMKRMPDEWSKARINMLKAMQEVEERKRLFEEIRSKKEELKKREQFLFFYDELKKRRLTRIDYN